MNKYQKALNDLAKNYQKLNYKDTGVDRLCAFQKTNVGVLQELIDKETPKKVKIEKWNDVVVGLVTEYHCPNCNKAVDLLSEKYPNFYKRPCCPNCGQKLDWSEE